MHEDPVASPWCSKGCSLSVACCITHNCLSLFWHGHSVEIGLSGFMHHTVLLGKVCVSVMIFFSVHFLAWPGYGHYYWDPWEDMRHSLIFSFLLPQVLILHSYLFGAPVVCRGAKKKKKKSFPSLLARSTRSRLYRFPLKLYLQKTGRMWALICPTLCNTWSGVAR